MEVKVFWTKWFAEQNKKESHNKNQKSIASSAEEIKIKAKKTDVELGFLHKLQPLYLLTAAELSEVQVLSEGFEPGQVIYKEGDPLAYVAYIVSGEVYCENGVGANYEVIAHTFKALYPLSNSPVNLFTAIARTSVKVIYLPKELLFDSSNCQKNNDLEQLGIAKKLQHSAFGQALFLSLQNDTIEMPSLPNVAIRLRVAVQKEIGVSEAVKIVNLDQGIAAKLVQVVNSPLYRGINLVNSCDAAVNRLGLIATRNLVTTFSMRSLFKSKNKALSKKLQQAWQQSIKVSSLCHTLAVLTNKVDPDEALLAGLTHNIGLLPIIALADKQEELALSEVEECLSIAQAYVGQYVLTHWGFSDSLLGIPYFADNWFYESGTEFDLVDVVILAKYHSLLGTAQSAMLPALHDLPAFQKLGNQGLTPDLSLQILYDAQQQVSEAMVLFEV